MADCGLPQLLIGQAIIPVIGCIRIGVIERPELVIGKCLIRTFSVNEKTVDALYSADYNIQRLERSVLEGGLKGKVDADNLVFALTAK